MYNKILMLSVSKHRAGVDFLEILLTMKLRRIRRSDLVVISGSHCNA